MKDRVEALEGLRGWAALLVVIYHLPKWHPCLDATVVVNGHFMVPLFFVLSGFVIHSAYAQRIDSPRALLRFQTLRFWRLYPVHLLFLALYFAFECVRWVAVHRFSVPDVRLAPFGQNSWTALVQQLLLVQAIGPTGNAQTFNGPAWSISVEFYTYLIFGLFALFCKRWLVFSLALLMLLGVGLLQKNTGFEILLTCIVGFSLGALVAALCEIWRPVVSGWVASVVLCVFFAYLAVVKDPQLGFVYALAAILVLSISGAKDGFAVKLLSDSRSLWLGAISYSLYMCHGLVIWLVSSVFKRIAGVPETLRSDGKWVLDMTGMQSGIALTLCIATAIGVAWLTMRFVEIPAREWSRRRVGVVPFSLHTCGASDRIAS